MNSEFEVPVGGTTDKQLEIQAWGGKLRLEGASQESPPNRWSLGLGEPGENPVGDEGKLPFAL